MAFKYACFIVTQALKVLTDAGLTSGKTDLRYVPSAKPGIVISQTPAAGTTVAAGAAVDLEVARAAQRTTSP